MISKAILLINVLLGLVGQPISPFANETQAKSKPNNNIDTNIQINYADEPEEILNWTNTGATRSHSYTTLLDNESTNIKYQSQKEIKQASNEAILINYSFYGNALISLNKAGPAYFWIPDNTWNDLEYKSDYLYILKITPYKGITDPSIELNFNARAESLVGTFNTTATAYMAIQNLDEYMNVSTYNTRNYAYNTYEELASNGNITPISTTNYVHNSGTYEYIDINMNINLSTLFSTYVIINLKTNITAYDSVQTSGTWYIAYNAMGGNIMAIIGATGGYEVIDIPDLMFNIITLPFAFISQAFNVTLFPNTPYQVNIATLFIAILAILILAWLLGKLIKVFGKS